MVSFYYNRFATFRKVLDAEMKDATKCGIAQKCQMDSREEITEDEDPQLGTHDLRPTDTPQKTSTFRTICMHLLTWKSLMSLSVLSFSLQNELYEF